MNSYAPPSRQPDADAMALAERLLGRPVLAAWPVPRGGNSRVFLIDAGEACYALKLYPRGAGDRRDRLATEYGAVRVLHGAGFADVPAPVASSPGDRAAIYEWIDGAPAEDIAAADIDAALDLLRRLVVLADSGRCDALGPASAACLSAAAALAQIEARFTRLGREVTTPPAALRHYLDDEFAPVHRSLARAAVHRLDRAGIPVDAVLAPERRLPSPSDFGFHNVMRRPAGGLVFVDMEYFGWDDPAKLVADFLLHPGHALPPAMAARFEQGVTALFGARDPLFAERLAALRPLFGLVWCLIVLNDFLPEVQTRRGLAGAAADEARAAQLAKARDRLASLWRQYESCQSAA